MRTSFVISTGAVVAFVGAASLLIMSSKQPRSTVGAVVTAPAPPPPDVIELTGVVRDFREFSVSGGHPDFEVVPSKGFGHYMRNIDTTIGSDGKPVFVGGGAKVNTDWRDSAGRPICFTLFDAARGDTAGSFGDASSGGVQSADSFNKWFNDVPGLNLSAALTLRLVRDSSGSYVFDDKLDPMYVSRGGFFPIEGQLFGNPGGSPDRNFHFTFELHTQFTFDADANQVFRFIGDDDVFVYIDGRLVIDLSGVHVAKDQFVELNRLGLTDGETYHLDFFFAERHRTQSNFRIQTNLELSTSTVPTINASYD